MVSKSMVVKAAEGLHMRPAGVIAREAGKFDSDVTIVFGDKRINAKSLVNIIAACIKKDAEITFECEGADEEAALAKMVEPGQSDRYPLGAYQTAGTTGETVRDSKSLSFQKRDS